MDLVCGKRKDAQTVKGSSMRGNNLQDWCDTLLGYIALELGLGRKLVRKMNNW